MEILTLEETISWARSCLYNGVDTESEEFWSNFSDAIMYMEMYKEVMKQFLEHRRRKCNGKSMENRNTQAPN